MLLKQKTQEEDSNQAQKQKRKPQTAVSALLLRLAAPQGLTEWSQPAAEE